MNEESIRLLLEAGATISTEEWEKIPANVREALPQDTQEELSRLAKLADHQRGSNLLSRSQLNSQDTLRLILEAGHKTTENT